MSLSIETGEFFDSRLTRLAVLLKQAFTHLLSDTPAEDVLGFALMTDAEAVRLTAALYRRGDHEHNLAVAHRRYAEAGVDWDLYLRWSPVEWPRTTTTAPVTAVPALTELWQTLLDRRAVANGVDRRYWPPVMFELAANALAVLYREGWFDDYPHSVRILHVADGVIDQNTRRRWVEAMNPDEAANSYQAHQTQLIGAPPA